MRLFAHGWQFALSTAGHYRSVTQIPRFGFLVVATVEL